jgi:hypothetical protein
MGSRFNSDTHQPVICRMIFYFVDTITIPIVGSQLRRKPIGEHTQINRLWFA